MKIVGLQKLTLLDYPGKAACTVFTVGCNFRCPFCQNADLVLPGSAVEEIESKDLLAFWKKRSGLLDGVCFSGGEPLLHPEIEELMEQAKGLGYLVKLDTNGSNPEFLKKLIEKGILDYVAMDIKNCVEKYAETVGIPDYDVGPVKESASILLEGKLPYEFRTTVVKEFHEREDFEKIGEWLCGAEKYFLQGFVDSGNLIQDGLHACTEEEMKEFQRTVKKSIPCTELRGV